MSIAIDIEQFTAPGKYYIDKSFDDINNELKNYTIVHNNSGKFYRRPKFNLTMNKSLERKTRSCN